MRIVGGCLPLSPSPPLPTSFFFLPGVVGRRGGGGGGILSGRKEILGYVSWPQQGEVRLFFFFLSCLSSRSLFQWFYCFFGQRVSMPPCAHVCVCLSGESLCRLSRTFFLFFRAGSWDKVVNQVLWVKAANVDVCFLFRGRFFFSRFIRYEWGSAVYFYRCQLSDSGWRVNWAAEPSRSRLKLMIRRKKSNVKT